MKKHHFPLLEVIKEKISISLKEENLLISSFSPLNKNKNDLLISVGGKSQALYFIVEGYIRCFHYDNKGNEITTNLLTGNSFVTSFESFQKNTIS
ncbi:MAG: cyclic nucleotide-binding domain-containing protein, partial [Flammeovirgaceae bacterium]|nr:cyclic nucleotide-binding domain-containing protein [Flammeovirgaceae bacterium]